jgi:hypothetical protein
MTTKYKNHPFADTYPLMNQAEMEALVAAEKVDDERVGESRRQNAQGLFPDFDLDDDYALGGGKRVAKRAANEEHMRMALAIDDENRRRVDAANDEKHAEFERLRVIFQRNPGISKEVAVAIYNATASNPGGAA